MNQPDVAASRLPVSIPIALLHQAFGDDPGAEVEVSAETVVLRFFVDEERTRWLEITTRREGRDAVFDCVVRFSDGRPLSENPHHLLVRDTALAHRPLRFGEASSHASAGPKSHRTGPWSARARPSRPWLLKCG